MIFVCKKSGIEWENTLVALPHIIKLFPLFCLTLIQSYECVFILNMIYTPWNLLMTLKAHIVCPTRLKVCIEKLTQEAHETVMPGLGHVFDIA